MVWTTVPLLRSVAWTVSPVVVSHFVTQNQSVKLRASATLSRALPPGGIVFPWLKPRRFARFRRQSIDDRAPDSEDDRAPDGEDDREERNSVPSSGSASSTAIDLGWLPALPHVLIASMANFLFGYHIGVMNGPIVSVARDLGFEGNAILQGLVVSIFIVGAFIGSLSSGYLVDNFGCRRTFQVNAVPLIVGALLCAEAHSLDEILWGRFLVGLGIGANTVLVPIYISEVSPTRYRGSLGTICQIGTCLGIIGSLLLGIPSDSIPDCFTILSDEATMKNTAGVRRPCERTCGICLKSGQWLCGKKQGEDYRQQASNM